MRLAFGVLISALSIVAVAQTSQMDPIVGSGQGQAIYRSVMPDGRVIFGDKPAPGAKESKQVQLRPSNISTPGPTSSPTQSANQPQSRQSSVEAASADVAEARKNVDRARATLEAGRTPNPDEMIGNVNSGKGKSTGGMRTTEAYDERIKALERDVEAAQRQYDEALNRRNESR